MNFPFFLLSCLLCGLATAQDFEDPQMAPVPATVSINNPVMYQASEKATLTLECTQEGFLLDFKQFENALGATLTLGNTGDPACSFAYQGTEQQIVRFPRSNFNNFDTCGATTKTDKDKTTVTNTVTVVQQYSGPTAQPFNWVICAKFGLSCCFVPGQPGPGLFNGNITELELCDKDDDFLITMWFEPQPGTLYWHQLISQISPIYGMRPDSCVASGQDKKGKNFRIPLVQNGCALNDPRMRLSITQISDGVQEYSLTTENEQLYADVTVTLKCESVRCTKENAPQNDKNSRCSNFWENNQLKSCAAPYAPVQPGKFPVLMSRDSTTKKICKTIIA